MTFKENIAADAATIAAVDIIRDGGLIKADVRRAEIITAAQLLSGERMMSLSAALDYLNEAWHYV